MSDIICPRCKRVAAGWPLVRADVCSPKDWYRCLRNLETVMAKLRAKRENGHAGP